MKKITSKLTLLSIGAMTIGGFFAMQSCSKSNGGSGTPPVTLIGGYASSDSVASANLIAYFPFNSDANDHQGGLTTTTSGITFSTTGVRGGALQGSASGYVTATLAAGNVFAGLTSFSVSVWFNLPALPSSGDPEGMFFVGSVNNPNEIILETDVPSPTQVGTDSVKIHHGFLDPGSPGYQGFTMESYDTNAVGKWEHLVMTYDGGSSTYILYQNAVPTGVFSAWSNGDYVTPTTMYDGPLPVGSGTPPTAPIGELNFMPDPPTSLVIATWPVGLYGISSTLGSNGCYVGQMDELRVFNVALTQQEVAGLFLNGQAGR